MVRRWRRWATKRRAEALIREGVGVSERVWRANGGDGAAAMAEGIADWARAEMAGMRRPFGVDHVVLALACRTTGGRMFCSASLGVVRPGAFYDGTAEQRLREALQGALGMAPDEGVEIQAALLRLGDLAYALQAEPAAA